MDKDSSYWNRFWEGPEIGLQWKHNVAAELVASEPVVDIGCGSGLLLELLRQRGFRSLLGCDISSSSSKLLKEKELDTLLCDANRPLPFVSDSFATATLVDVLEHSFDPERVLAEAARVAREVVVVVPNFNSVVARVQVAMGRVPENNTPRKRHVYWFNYETLAPRRLHGRTRGRCRAAPYVQVRPPVARCVFAVARSITSTLALVGFRRPPPSSERQVTASCGRGSLHRPLPVYRPGVETLILQ